ncbi:hypothetical protein [Sphingomonas sp. Marseille-Q8236]
MDPMLDPDLIEFMDDETLLAAFQMVSTAPDNGDRTAILDELTRRDLTPVPVTPDLVATNRTDQRCMTVRL